MVTVLNTRKTVPRFLEMEAELPESERTLFHVRRLKWHQKTRIMYLMAEAWRQLGGVGTPTSVQDGSSLMAQMAEALGDDPRRIGNVLECLEEAVGIGIAGWDNLKDDEGEAFKAEVKDGRLTDDSLSWAEIEHLFELTLIVLEENQLTKDEGKKSKSPQDS